MNWEAVGAIGEVAGAVAVVLTLTYLAAQIRQNTRSTRATTYSDTTRGWHDYLQNQSVEDIELLGRITANPGELALAEFYRAFYLCRVLFRRMEHDYYQYQAGTFDSKSWEAYLVSFHEDTFSNPGIRAMWRLQSHYLDPSFAQYMQKYIDDVAHKPLPHFRSKFDVFLAEELNSEKQRRVLDEAPAQPGEERS